MAAKRRVQRLAAIMRNVLAVLPATACDSNDDGTAAQKRHGRLPLVSAEPVVQVASNLARLLWGGGLQARETLVPGGCWRDKPQIPA